MLRFPREKCPVWVAVALACGNSSCATDPARERLKQGNDLEVAELCVEDAPGTRPSVCEEARLRAIDARLENLHRLRDAGRSAGDLASLAELDQILRLSGERPLPPNSKTAQVVADELARARDSLQTSANGMADRPLASEAYWAARTPFLQRAPLHAWMDRGLAETRKSGQRICSRLQANAQGERPYRDAVIHLYCTHFGDGTGVASPARAQFKVVFRTSDLAADQQDIVRQELSRVFAQTPWSTSPLPVAIEATVTGKYECVQTDQVVVLHGAYIDRHLAYPLMFPGRGSLMIVPQTVDYPYEARDHWRRYEANLTVTVALPDQPFVHTLRKGESLHGRDHDVTFEPANIHPVHTSPPTADHWLAMEFGAFAAHLRDALNQRWIEEYCSASVYSVEDAARCLLAGQTSEPVLAAIAEALADDRQAVARLAAPTAP